MENLNKLNNYLLIFSNILYPIFYDGFLSMYNDGTKLCDNSNILLIYQSILKNIPKWDDDILTTETNRILNVSNFSNLNNLYKVILKLHIKIFTNSYSISDKYINIDFKNFIHKCYISISKDLYHYPELFYSTNKDYTEKRDSIIKLNDVIKKGIELTFKKLLPLDDLLEEELKPDTNIKDSNAIPNININSVVSPKLDISNPKVDLTGGGKNRLSYNNILSKTKDSLTKDSLTKDSLTKNSLTKNSNTKSYYSDSHSTSNKKYSSVKHKNKKPELINDDIIESAYSNLTTNTNAIIKKVSKDPHVLSSDKSQMKSLTQSTIKTIAADTSISYNIDNDNNYVSVFNNEKI
jgi:hypothetical protein